MAKPTKMKILHYGSTSHPRSHQTDMKLSRRLGFFIVVSRFLRGAYAAPIARNAALSSSSPNTSGTCEVEACIGLSDPSTLDSDQMSPELRLKRTSSASSTCTFVEDQPVCTGVQGSG
ncbi:hypothetical protein Moror_1427 [Moniliophthora roreri MCA 2997]|uniref:Uncharacterized protein n=2 Tax=Moniliophthora roreri TaxID=221103 RepID=V2YPW2_MONRO|nr:hypothetical protein Moror_1427 [Moniliophthora roreri MCA 2997]KAI3596732.1 hypothetical protein WG66_016404 [Moniliophthora roreri]